MNCLTQITKKEVVSLCKKNYKNLNTLNTLKNLKIYINIYIYIVRSNVENDFRLLIIFFKIANFKSDFQ